MLNQNQRGNKVNHSFKKYLFHANYMLYVFIELYQNKKEAKLSIIVDLISKSG